MKKSSINKKFFPKKAKVILNLAKTILLLQYVSIKMRVIV